MQNAISIFQKSLIDWFTVNQRQFPWRKEEISNYELIISEILLQRTKAETVSKYYTTFFDTYPNWDRLVQADNQALEQILKPLGLYRHRAKRLMKIIQEYQEKNGILPQNREELQESNLSSLYISNAYELFILKHRAALVDVNMSRLLSRYFQPQNFKDVRHDKPIQELAGKVVDVEQCKELNWAILDFAALICQSRKPKCPECLLRAGCKFFITKTDE
jgi:A/G-specific adenine glycosylase